MSGRMRKRKPKDPGLAQSIGMARSFHASQKDTSKRARKRVKLNDYKQDQQNEENSGNS